MFQIRSAKHLLVRVAKALRVGGRRAAVVGIEDGRADLPAESTQRLHPADCARRNSAIRNFHRRG